MKKFFFFAAAALAALTANAYTLNNPIGEDGRYRVKYDCEKGQFAEANDFEYSETVTLAFDIKNTWLEEWLKGTPITAGAERGVAINWWGNNAGTDPNVRRLVQMEGTIWGMTVNIKQISVADSDHPHPEYADTIGDVSYMGAQFFGFEYTSEESGALWWQWDGNEINNTWADGADCLFATLPYTGTKNDPALYVEDYANGYIYGFDITGYAAPCLDEATAVENVTVVTARKVIENGQLILVNGDVRYNVLGAQVK